MKVPSAFFMKETRKMSTGAKAAKSSATDTPRIDVNVAEQAES